MSKWAIEMKRLLSLIIVALSCLAFVPRSHGDLKAVVQVEDLRVSERRVYIRQTLDGKTVTGIKLFLPAGESPKALEWVILYETEEVLRKAIEIARHNDVGSKVQVIGREVVTFEGRALLISSIRSGWSVS